MAVAQIRVAISRRSETTIEILNYKRTVLPFGTNCIRWPASRGQREPIFEFILGSELTHQTT